MTAPYIAQFNVARMHAPMHDPRMASLTEALEFVNELGRRAPGFVWLLDIDRSG